MAKAIEAKKAPAAVKIVKEKKAAGPKLPFGKKFGTLVLKTKQRFEKAVARVSALEDASHAEVAAIKVALSNAVQALDSAAVKLTGLPDDFTGGKAKAAGGGAVVVGSVVSIREKRKAEYEGLLEDAELASLTVLTVKGAKLVLKTASGNKIFMPKAHVQVAKAAA